MITWGGFLVTKALKDQREFCVDTGAHLGRLFQPLGSDKVNLSAKKTL